jgi:hypothetical protein
MVAPSTDAELLQQQMIPLPMQTEVLTATLLPWQQYQKDLSAFELAAFAKRPRHAFFPAALRFRGNDVTAIVDGATSSAALLVWGDRNDLEASLVLDGNRFRNSAATVATAAGLFVERCAVSGNVIANEGKIGAPVPGAAAPALVSLELFVIPEATANPPAAQVPAVAVTGNVFRGKTVLPNRTLSPQPPPPMDTWDFFNTTV